MLRNGNCIKNYLFCVPQKKYKMKPVTCALSFMSKEFSLKDSLIKILSY